MLTRYIIQHKTADRKRWVDEQVFLSALDTYATIHMWRVLWPRYKHRVIERIILNNGDFTETVLSQHK